MESILKYHIFLRILWRNVDLIINFFGQRSTEGLRDIGAVVAVAVGRGIVATIVSI